MTFDTRKVTSRRYYRLSMLHLIDIGHLVKHQHNTSRTQQSLVTVIGFFYIEITFNLLLGEKLTVYFRECPSIYIYIAMVLGLQSPLPFGRLSLRSKLLSTKRQIGHDSLVLWHVEYRHLTYFHSHQKLGHVMVPGLYWLTANDNSNIRSLLTMLYL